MKLKLVENLKNGQIIISCAEDLVDLVENKNRKYFYFAKDNEHKDLIDLKKKLEDKNFSVHLREAAYTIDDDYVYEMHVIN